MATPEDTMLDEAIKAKLRDAAYLDLHLQAMSAIRRIGDVDWYDSHFLRRIEVAKLYLADVRPDALEAFVRGFDVLMPPPGFANVVIDDLFDAAAQERIRETARSIPAQALEDYEMRDFGRHIIHDHPAFIELQEQLLARISKLVGLELERGYNFLSLYGGSGRCDPHMDEPGSMFTLDYCIEQSDDWPIWFSKVVDWPTLETMRNWDPHAIKADPAMEFAAHILQPGQALLFNGSSQWHYRDAITPGGFCSLLFFHYFPAGTYDLVWPRHWHRHFAIPELGPLCDFFHESGRDGLT
jgi:hypothetical protein